MNILNIPNITNNYTHLTSIDYRRSCRGRKPLMHGGVRYGTPVNVLFTSKASGEKFKRRAVRTAGTYYLCMPNGWRECRKLAEKNGYDFDVLGRFGRKGG